MWSALTLEVESEETRGNRLSDDDLVFIVERASSAFERLGPAFAGSATAPSIEILRAAWRDIVADGDEVRFRHRLSWDGLTEADVERMLAPVRLRQGELLPSWAHLLQDLCDDEAPPSGEGKRLASVSGPEGPLPYQDAMAPFVEKMLARLRTDAGGAMTPFSKAAVAQMGEALLRRLGLFMTEMLHLEFGIFRRKHLSNFDLLLLRMGGHAPTDVYDAFIAFLRAGGMRTLCLRYPVMARLASTACLFWLDATLELVRRFEGDGEAIAASFGWPAAALHVESLETLLSDSHNGGRSVAILTCGGGRRLVYKPRPVDAEAAWFGLLSWLNERHPPDPLKTLTVLQRPGYGWVEAVAAEPLPDLAAARRYYRKAGALLALTYAIGTNDLHYENLIACGEDPVLIDLETVMCHAPRETIAGLAADDLLKTVFFESVVRTGLLPRWQAGASGAFDVSGLGAVVGQRSRIAVPQWKDVNTDLVELVHETMLGSHGRNAPLLNGESALPEDYLPAITSGFRQMYRLLQRERVALLAGPIRAFECLPVRFLLRATAQYMFTLKASRAPHLLRDGAERSIHLERLLAPMTGAAQPPLAWPLTRLERRALDQEDVPYFTAMAAGAEIDDPAGEPLPEILEGPCFARTVSRIRKLSATGLRNQLALVRAAIEARIEPDPHGIEPLRARPTAVKTEARGDMPDPAAFLGESVRIAETILSASIPGAGGAPHWITLRHLPGLGKMQLDPLGPDLFEGRAGIALALAAIAAETGHGRIRAAAEAITQDLARELRDLARGALPDEVLVHGMSGVVSLSYAFVHLARLLGDPGLIEDAELAVGLLTDDRIAQDTRFDVLSGGAGSLLSMLPLVACGSAGARGRAIACGDHLLACRIESSSGERCWATFEDRPISGMAHGNSGIALALLRLGDATGDSRYRDAGLEAIAFENRTYSREADNWPDLRWRDTSYAAGWCHGAPGMAFARLEALGISGGDAGALALRRDVDAGARTAGRAKGGGADHLCCGNMGRALVQHEIGLATHNDAITGQAWRTAADIVRRAAGKYRFAHHYSGYLSFPGLFQGSAGVAYALLRMARPKTSPDFISLR